MNGTDDAVSANVHRWRPERQRLQRPRRPDCRSRGSQCRRADGDASMHQQSCQLRLPRADRGALRWAGGGALLARWAIQQPLCAKPRSNCSTSWSSCTISCARLSCTCTRYAGTREYMQVRTKARRDICRGRRSLGSRRLSIAGFVVLAPADPPAATVHVCWNRARSIGPEPYASLSRSDGPAVLLLPVGVLRAACQIGEALQQPVRRTRRRAAVLRIVSACTPPCV